MICARPSAIVLVGLVHLHLQCRTCVSSVETNNIQSPLAERVHEPWRHRAGFQPDTSVLSRMPFYDSFELHGIGGALTTPYPSAGLVDNADRGQLL